MLKREWMVRGATVMIGVAAALLLGEVAVRILEPREDTRSIPLPESERIYGLAPRSVGYAGGIEYQANSWGYRGRDVDEIDHDKDTVLIVLGDSYAFGYGVQVADAFPSVLETTLHSAYPHRVIKVMTLALPGYNTAQYLAALKEFGPVLQPSLVVLSYHLNDIERHGRADGATSESRRGRSPKDYMHLLRFILPRLAAMARALNMSVTTTVTREVTEYADNGEAWRRNKILLEELVATTKDLKAGMAVVILPYMVQLDEKHPALEAYRSAGQFFESLRVPTVNAFEYFKGEDPQNLWINPFDGHPNARGHRIIAKAVTDLIVTHQLIKLP
jgi:lysophospholipase L1-like esterase